MYLQRFIKLLPLLLLGLLISNTSHGKGDSSVVVSSPYKTEYNPWYKLSVFQRGFESDTLTPYLDKLENTPRKNWSRKDSLDFARISLQTGKIELSQYYFDNLNLDYDQENEYWWDRMMIYILNKNYEGGIESIHKSSPGILEYSKIYFLDKILLAYMAEARDPKWHKSNLVFNWEIDSSVFELDKKSDEFNESIIKPLENLNFVLKHLIHHIHEEDPIIALSCFEMGIIFENHISLTQAYISYSLGRHYNKWDKEILNNVKRVKGRLSGKKYKIPIFRRYFPRIEGGRMEYEVLKEKIILEKLDTIPKNPPILMLPKKEKELPFSPDIIVLGGIFLLFLLILIFLKAKK